MSTIRPYALVVENDPDWSALIRGICSRAGFVVDIAETTDAAFNAIEKYNYQFVALDVTLGADPSRSEVRSIMKSIRETPMADNVVVAVVTGPASRDTKLVTYGYRLFGSQRFNFFPKSDFAERRPEFDELLNLAKHTFLSESGVGVIALSDVDAQSEKRSLYHSRYYALIDLVLLVALASVLTLVWTETSKAVPLAAAGMIMLLVFFFILAGIVYLGARSELFSKTAAFKLLEMILAKIPSLRNVLKLFSRNQIDN